MGKFILRRFSFAGLLILLGVFMSGCMPPGEPEKIGQQESSAGSVKDTEITAQAVAVIEDSGHQMVFDMSMDDFIDRYNSVYQYKHGETFLPPSQEWPFYNTMAVHSENEAICYHFSEDEKIRAIPVISVYVPLAGDRVQQIMLSYDDHSYSIPTYQMYEEMCYCTLKVMFPDIGDEELTGLYQKINTLADENITDVPYSADAVPCELYYREGIGVYPYFCVGEELHFCVIPVTEEMLEAFEEKGTVIQPIL